MTEHNRPIDLPDGDAIDDLLATEDVVLLEFYTSGCGACTSMEPVLGVVAKQTDAVVATCNPGTTSDSLTNTTSGASPRSGSSLTVRRSTDAWRASSAPTTSST